MDPQFARIKAEKHIPGSIWDWETVEIHRGIPGLEEFVLEQHDEVGCFCIEHTDRNGRIFAHNFWTDSAPSEAEFSKNLRPRSKFAQESWSIVCAILRMEGLIDLWQYASEMAELEQAFTDAFRKYSCNWIPDDPRDWTPRQERLYFDRHGDDIFVLGHSNPNAETEIEPLSD